MFAGRILAKLARIRHKWLLVIFSYKPNPEKYFSKKSFFLKQTELNTFGLPTFKKERKKKKKLSIKFYKKYEVIN